jgi:hypothetical protein
MFVTSESTTWDTSTSSVGASPVRTSVARAEELASLVLAAAFGTSTLESLRSCVRASSSSRTSQVAPSVGWTLCAETWDGSAMKRYRSRLAQAISAHPTDAHAFSSSALLPTPTTKSWHRQRMADGREVCLREAVPLLPTPTASSYGTNHGGAAGRTGKVRPSLRTLVPTLTVRGNHNRAGASDKSGDGLATAIADGPLNPTWLEWFMGFPDGWTESEHSVTQSCRSRRKSSGTSSAN